MPSRIPDCPNCSKTDFHIVGSASKLGRRQITLICKSCDTEIRYPADESDTLTR